MEEGARKAKVSRTGASECGPTCECVRAGEDPIPAGLQANRQHRHGCKGLKASSKTQPWDLDSSSKDRNTAPPSTHPTGLVSRLNSSLAH